MGWKTGKWHKWADDDWDWWDWRDDEDDEEDDDDDSIDFGPPEDGRTTLLEDSVNTMSSLDPGELWAGDGNTPFNFSISENESEGLEIALKAKVRQSADEVPYDPETNTYVVPSGLQDSKPDRAAWNFDFSVNADTDDDGVIPDGSRVKLEFDVDKSEDVDYRTIVDAPFEDYLASGLVTSGPDDTVFDGSQNPIFGFIADLFPEDSPYDEDDTGFYNIRLSFLRNEDDEEDEEDDDDELEVEVIASVEITVHVIGAEEFQDIWLV